MISSLVDRWRSAWLSSQILLALLQQRIILSSTKSVLVIWDSFEKLDPKKAHLSAFELSNFRISRISSVIPNLPFAIIIELCMDLHDEYSDFGPAKTP